MPANTQGFGPMGTQQTQCLLFGYHLCDGLDLAKAPQVPRCMLCSIFLLQAQQCVSLCGCLSVSVCELRNLQCALRVLGSL